MERLQKVMSNCGVASRRASEQMILDGRVRVNGVVVRELGTKVDPDKDIVLVDGQRLEMQPKHYYLFNKPKGVITTSSDDQGRTTVMEYFKKEKGNGALEGLISFCSEDEMPEFIKNTIYSISKTIYPPVENQDTSVEGMPNDSSEE